MVDGATSEWIKIVSGENRLHSYADDFTLLAVVPKPADRPDVAASLNRDLAIGFRSGTITCARY